VATHAMRATGDAAVVGILYPGHAAESEYVRAGQLVGGSARFPLVHTSVGRDTHEIDALMDTGAAWRLEDGWASLRHERPGAVMWACTSGSFVFGLDGAREQARRLSTVSSLPASSTSLAFVAALEALGIDRVAVGATYPDDVDERFRTFLEDAGVRVVRIGGLGIMDASDGARLTAADLVGLATANDHPEARAILLPDTAVHTLEHLPAIAAAVGKVVLSANQVTVWEGLRLVGHVPGSDPLAWGSPAPSGRELSAPPSGRGQAGGASQP
jgi:maleate cis-trans isomerase